MECVALCSVVQRGECVQQLKAAQMSCPSQANATCHLADVMSALRLRNVTSSEGGVTQSDCSSITGSEPSSDRRLEVRAEERVGAEESLGDSALHHSDSSTTR